jgi:alpha-beta hydrolase superfamily lysophospholipase
MTQIVERSALDYPAAMARLEELRTAEGTDLLPECRTALRTHEHQTERAVVLIHGLTNCPAQYSAFAPLLFERGSNVLVPRLPHHGLADRGGTALRELTVTELREFGNLVVDVACGLGRRVTVVGLSAGGVVASWIAQFRPEVERVVAIAPALGVLPNRRAFGYGANRAVLEVLARLPNHMSRPRPFDAERPPHTYASVATRGLAAVLRLGALVLAAAKRSPPAAREIVVVTNEHDGVVNNAVTAVLVRRWRRHGGMAVHTFVFPRQQQLLHDLIDPLQRRQQTTHVYPTLLDLIDPQERG